METPAARDVETATFPVHGQDGYVMVGNPRDLVYYRLTPAEAEVLGRLDRQHSIADILATNITPGTGLDLDIVADLVGALERGGFLTTGYFDVARTVHPPWR